MAEASRSAEEKDFFSRVNLALTDCGRRVLLQLLLRKVEELTPIDHPVKPWSLDDFLNHNKEDISLYIGKNNNKRKLILYPGLGKKTDLTKWDIPLFVFVLLNACKLDHNDALDRPLQHDIGNLSNLRNKMLHKGAPVLKEPTYRKYFDRIVGAVQRICDYMQEPALKESFRKELSQYGSLRHVFQNDLISEFGCKSVDMINEADSAVENGLQQMQMIIQKKGLSVNIPVLDVIVMFRNYSRENEQAITERLHRTFSEALEQSKEFSADMRADRTASEVDDVVKSLVRKLFDEKKEITKVGTGCLVLSIQCHDIDAVISLVQDSLSGKLGSLFEPLEEVMQTYEDHVLFEVCVGITRKSCWALLNDMFCQVSDKCGHRSYTVESTVQGGSIVVRTQCFLQSFTAKELLEKSFSTKEKDEVCKQLMEELTFDLKQPGMDMIIMSPKNSIEGGVGDSATGSASEQKTFDFITRFLEKDSRPKSPHYKPKTRVHSGEETIEVSKMEQMEGFDNQNELIIATQTGLVLELYQTQTEAAKFMELGMLKLWNHPKIAKDVRMSATTTRMLLQNTVGLMTKFKTTSHVVVNKIVPIILIGIEKKDEAIIRASLQKIAAFASDMQTETTNTKDRYNEVVHKVNGSIGDIETENHDIMKSTKEKQCLIDLENRRIKETDFIVKMLEEDVKEQNTAVKALEKETKEARDDLVKAAVLTGERKEGSKGEDFRKEDDEDLKAGLKAAEKEARAELMASLGSLGKGKERSRGAEFLLETFNPWMLAGGTVEQALKVVRAGVALSDDVFLHVKQERQYALKKDAHETIKNATKEQSQELQKRKREVQEQRELKLQQIHTIKMLNMKIEAGIGDMENLKEAILHLGKAQRILSKISGFWEGLSNVVKVLQANDDANDLHLLTMKYDQRDIRKAIEESKTYWEMFGIMCHGYVSQSQSNIGPMYAFLEKPLDSLSPTERMERTRRLLDSIEEGINETYPATIAQ
ncbi:uncharacterized protein LOC128240743 isoform X2 [Mya arenaria]|uniref:uncharacterized protein LOC128240743 isoform X2 n=1 Tax=Mya arenaria TaxID=6604 RepID=UPI0022E22A8A|nr:uncharacterized protein LOC128240743 isoform X2 [Mya arenaria]